jgi:hypothetical protein
MNTFDDRQKGFERKYVLDEELAFKANVRRNKLLGLWAAEKLGKTGSVADEYAKDVVAADFEHHGDDDVLKKVENDFKAAKVALSAADIRAEMERLMPIARQQVAGEKA